MGLRARFPTYHTEIDEMLLKDGYHCPYQLVPGLGIHALQIWKSFMIFSSKHGFNPRLSKE